MMLFENISKKEILRHLMVKMGKKDQNFDKFRKIFIPEKKIVKQA